LQSLCCTWTLMIFAHWQATTATTLIFTNFDNFAQFRF
jgi:hypothetical protein